MSTRARLGLLLVTASTVALTGGVPSALADTRVPAQATSIVVDHGTVRLVLTVGALPEGATLEPTSIRVTAGGKRWPATARAVSGSSSTVARIAILAIDTSGSMAPRLADAQAAAAHFLQIVPADVRVGLVTFSDQARLVVGPTTDRRPVNAALAGMRANGETALYDGIGVALNALGTRGDRALILLSDGLDTKSRASLASTGASLGRSGASVDLVSFGEGGGQQQALQQLAARAHGRLLQADNGAQLSDVFADSARRLVNQVVVTAQIPPELTGGPTELTVQVDAGKDKAVSAVRLALPMIPTGRGVADPTAASPSVVHTEVPWLLTVVLVVAFLVLFLLFAVGLNSSTWRESSSRKRTREIGRYSVAGPGGSRVADAAPAAVTQAALAWAGRTVQRRGVEDSWRMELDRAAVPLRPHEWLIIRLGAVLAAMAFSVVALPLWLLTAPLAGLAAWLLSGAYLRFKAARRVNRFAENLPDVLQLIAGSLRSGFSLPQAVDNAAKDGEQPIAGELSRALAESRLGVELEDALDRVADRMRSTDFTWTVMAVRIAREVGGNLAEVLLSTAETMRERSRIQRQVKVLSAEGRLSAYVLIALPVGITAFMVLFRGSYIAPLVTDPIGWVMTIYGVLSVLVGTWWMSRMIKLEV